MVIKLLLNSVLSNTFAFLCEGGGGHFAGEKVKLSPDKYCDPQKQMHCLNRHELEKCIM